MRQLDINKLARPASSEGAYASQREVNPDVFDPIEVNVPRLSKYDKGLTLNPSDPYGSVMENRGQMQTIGDKFANGTAKLGITALTTAADGILGTIVGLGNVAAGKSFIDNPFSQSMQQIQEWSREALPNYYTKEETESGVLEGMKYSNFWFDKVFNGFGFMLGAVGTGLLTGGTSFAASGGKAAMTRLAREAGESMATKILKGETKSLLKDAEFIKAAKLRQISGDELIKNLAKDAKQVKNARLASQLISGTVASSGEARIEAISAMNEFKESKLAEVDSKVQSGEISQQEAEVEKQNINKSSEGLANSIFAMNMAILTPSNLIQFGHMFGGSYKMNKTLMSGITGDVSKGYELARKIPTTKLGKVARGAEYTLFGLKNSLVEGQEEASQFIAQKSSEHYYNETNPEARKRVGDIMESFTYGLEQAYGTKEGLEQFLIGSIIGSIGMPGKGGNIVSEVKQQFAKDKYTQATVDKLNEYVKNPEFQNYYTGLVKQFAIQDKQDKAFDEGDLFNYKNEDHSKAVAMMETFYNAGKIEELESWASSMKNKDPEDWRNMMMINKDKEGNEVEPKSLFENKNDDEINKFVQDKSNKTLEQIKAYKQIREDLDGKFGSSLDGGSKVFLADRLATIKDVENREQDIHRRIQEITKITDGRDITDLNRQISKLKFNRKNLSILTELVGKRKQLETERQLEEDKLAKFIAASGTHRVYKEQEIELSRQEKLIQDKIAEFGEKFNQIDSQIDNLLQTSKLDRDKVVEQFEGLYKDMSFNEYKQNVLGIADKIDELKEKYNGAYNELYNTNYKPEFEEELNQSFEDLNRLNIRREQTLETYFDAVQKLRKNPNELKEVREKVEKELVDRNIKAYLKRFDNAATRNVSGITIVEASTGKEFTFRKINNTYYVYDKNTGLGVKETELNEEFAKQFVFPKDFENIVKAAEVVEITNENSLGKFSHQNGDELVVSAIKVKYKTKETGEEKEYVAIPFGENQYKLFHTSKEGELSHSFFLVDKLNATVFDGEVKSYKFLGKIIMYKDKAYLAEDVSSFILDRFNSVQPDDVAINEEELEDKSEEDEDSEGVIEDEKPIFQVKVGGSFRDVFRYEDIASEISEADPKFIARLYEASFDKDKNKRSIKVKVGNKEYELRRVFNKDEIEKPVKIRIKYLKTDKWGKPIVRKDKKGFITQGKSYEFNDSDFIENLEFKKVEGQLYGIYTDKSEKNKKKRKKYVQIEWSQKENEDITFLRLSKSGEGIWWNGIDKKGEKKSKALTLRQVINYGGVIQKDKVETISVYGVEGFKVPIQFKNLKGETFISNYFVPKPQRLTNNNSLVKNSYLTKYDHFTVSSMNSLQLIYPTSNGKVILSENKEKTDPETISNHEFSEQALPKFFEGVLLTTTDSYWLRKVSEKDKTVKSSDLIPNMQAASSSQEKANVRYEIFNNNFNIASGEYQAKIKELTAEEVGALDDSGKPLFEGKGKFVFIINKKGEFVNEKNEVISEDKAIDEGIYTSVAEPTYEVTNSKEYPGDTNYWTLSKNGQEKVAPSEDKKALEQERDNYKDFYNSLINNEIVPIRGKLQGKAVYGNEFVKTTEALEGIESEVELNTTGIIEINGVPIRAKKGFIFAKNKKNGNIIELQPRNVSEDEINTIINLLNIYVSGVDKEGNLPEGAEKVTASILSNAQSEFGGTGVDQVFNLFKDGIERIVYMQSRNNVSYKDVYLDKVLPLIQSYSEAWKNITTMSLADDSINLKEQQSILIAGLRQELKQVQEGNLENRNIKTQFYLMNNLFSSDELEGETHLINIGGEVYPLINYETKKLPEETQKALREFLLTRNIQISSQIAKATSENEVSRISSVKQKEDNSYDVQGEYISNGQQYIKENSLTQQIVSNEVPSRVGQSILFVPSVKEPKQASTKEENDNQEDLKKQFEQASETSSKSFSLSSLIANAAEVESVATITKEQEKHAESLVKKEESTTNKVEIPNRDEEASFRLAKFGNYVVEDLDKAEAWFKERFGDKVDFKIVTKLIAGKAFGSFKDAAVYIYENAEIGTTYHEAFHAVTQMFLTNSQVKYLYNEVRLRKSNKGKKLTNKEIEEILAEEFRDYVMSDGKIKPELPIQRNFFQKLLDFIKGLFVNNPNSVQEIFDKVNTGFYKDERPLRFESNNLYRNRIGDRNSTYTKHILDGIHHYFVQKLLAKKGEGLIYDLFSYKGIGKEDLNPIFEEIQTTLTKKASDYKEDADNTNYNQSVRESSAKKYEEITHALNNWSQVIDAYVDYLKIYNLDLKTTSIINQEPHGEEEVNDGKTEENKTGGRNEYVDYDTLKVSTKKNASKIIKLFIGTLANTYIDSNGKEFVTSNPLGLPTNVNFGETFSLLTNKLSGHPGFEQVKIILNKLETNNDLKWVKILKSRLSLNKIDKEELSFNEINTIIQFVQTFARNKNNFVMALIDENGKTPIIDSNFNSLSKKIRNNWEYNTIKRINEGDDLFIKSEGGVFYNKTNIKKKFPIVNDVNLLQFLNAIGIELKSQPVGENLKVALTKAVSIHQLLIRENGTNRSSLPFIFTKYRKTDIQGDIDFFIELQSKDPLVTDTIENGHYNLNGDLVYDATLHGFITYMINNLNDIRTNLVNENRLTEENFYNELFSKFPYFADPYIQNSIVIKNFIREGVLKMEILEGSRESNYSDGKEFSALQSPDRLRLWFQMSLEGKYTMSRPADNGQERFFQFGKLISNSEIAKEEYIKTFHNYLLDEVSLRINLKNDSIKYKRTTGKNLYKGIIIDIFKDNKFLTDNIIDSIDKGDTNILKQASFKTAFGTVLRDYFNSKTNETIELFEKNRIIDRTSSTNYRNYGLDVEVTNLTPDEIKTIISRFVINTFASKVEQTKLFLGDPIFNKSLTDKFKRNNGAISPKKIGIDHPFITTWIEKNMKRVDEASSDKVDSLVDSNGKKLLRTAVMEDVQVVSELLEEYSKVSNGGNKLNTKTYQDMTEGDGMSQISLDEWRELVFRNGDWSNDHELFYQYNMQKYIGKLVQLGKVKPTVFANAFGHVSFDVPLINNKAISKKDASHIKINSLKVQYFGPMANVKGYRPTMYKTSAFVMLPSMWMDIESGEITRPNLYKVDEYMRNNKVGIVSHYSSNKGMTTIETNNSFYSDINSRTLNDLNTTVTQDTYYEFWGIQQDTGFKSKQENTTGTQMMKQIWNGIYSEGVASNDELHSITEKLLELNSKRLEFGKKKLLDKLGLTLDESGNYKYNEKIENLKKSLRDEAIKRTMPDNIIEAIEFIDFGLGVEPIIGREKIENILFSLADKTTISQKMFGKPSYQVAPTLFEEFSLEETQTKEGSQKYLTSNRLKFYRTENGEFKQMEIFLPSWFKGKVAIGELDKSLLQVIGFRIPTQGLNSIESIIVKGFLPESLGDVVVMPTEIVAKAGSDYDIDKLNIYLPNFYVTEQGKYVHIPTNLDQLDSNYETYSSVVNDKNKLTKDEFILKAIENGMLENMHKLILHPENRYQLLSSVEASELKEIQWEINAIDNKIDPNDKEAVATLKKQKEDDTSLDNFGDITYNNDITKQNMEGAGGVGITALVSTFNIIACRFGFTLNESFEITKADKKKQTIQTKIYLPHNSKDGKVNIGKNTDSEGKFIWQAISEYITACVDNAKELILKDINSGLKTLNTVLYLKMAGVSTRTIHYFMTQPIIKEYVEAQEIYESQNAESNEFALRKDPLIAKVKSKYGDLNYEQKEITLDMLKETKVRFVNNKATLEDKKLQLQILDDFIRYQETAKVISNAVQAISYDTKSYGKNMGELMYRVELKDKVISKKLINGFEEALNGSFIKPYREAVEQLQETYSPLFITKMNKDVDNEYKRVLRNYMSDGLIMGRDRIIEVLDRWKQSFISYLLVTKPQENNTSIISEKERLFTGVNSVPNKIAKIQKAINDVKKGDKSSEKLDIYNKYKENSLIKNFQPVHSENDKYDYLFFQVRNTDTMDVNQYVDDWNVLLDSGDSLGMDLVKFVLIQSGIQGSPMNFVNFVPSKVYGTIIQKALTGHEGKITTEEMQNFTTQFFIHNYDNNDIVPERWGNKIPKININDEGEVVQPFYKKKMLKADYEDKLKNLTWQDKKAKIKEYLANGEKPYASVPTLFWSQPFMEQLAGGINPSSIKEYPLVGFENRRDFRENKSLLDYKTSIITMETGTTTTKKDSSKKEVDPEKELLDCPVPILTRNSLG